MTTPDEQTASRTAVDLARVEALLGYLREDVKGLREQIAANANSLVQRGEWVQRNESVEARFRAQGREIAELRTELRAHRLPWPTVVAAVVSVAALGLTIVQAVA